MKYAEETGLVFIDSVDALLFSNLPVKVPQVPVKEGTEGIEVEISQSLDN